jgi:hypothetical protein
MNQHSQPEGGAGEAAGGSSGPAPQTPEPERTEGSGDVEIPLGVPVDPDEFERLKEKARRLDSEEADADDADEGDEGDEGDEHAQRDLMNNEEEGSNG